MALIIIAAVMLFAGIIGWRMPTGDSAGDSMIIISGDAPF